MLNIFQYLFFSLDIFFKYIYFFKFVSCNKNSRDGIKHFDIEYIVGIEFTEYLTLGNAFIRR